MPASSSAVRGGVVRGLKYRCGRQVWARPQGRASCGGGGVRYMSKATGVRPPIGGATTSDPLRPPRPPCDPLLGPRPGAGGSMGQRATPLQTPPLAVTIMLTYVARRLVRASRSPHFIIRGQSRGVSEKGKGNRRVWVGHGFLTVVSRGRVVRGWGGGGVGRPKAPKRLVASHSGDDDKGRVVVPACEGVSGVKVKKGRE